MTGNANVLAGISCPACGNQEEFRIAITAVAKVTDDGIEIVGDTEWDDGSFCMCNTCDHDGIVHDFMAGGAA